MSNPFDACHLDDGDAKLIGEPSDFDEAVGVWYSHDVFLLWDAIAKLARRRYVVRCRHHHIMDTNIICDGDTIIFDREKYERLNGER